MGEDDLMDPSKMDGPTISWTVADLTKFNNSVFLTYHVMGSGCSYMGILGTAIGCAALPSTTKFSDLTRLQAAGTGGLIGGAAGAGLGFTLMTSMMIRNPSKFDKDARQTRTDGISHNYKIRALDLGQWIGIAVAGGALVAAGGPTQLGMSAGKFGIFQTLALGSAAGSLGAIGISAVTK